MSADQVSNEGHIPVRAFVSMVRRTMRSNTKLEKWPTAVVCLSFERPTVEMLECQMRLSRTSTIIVAAMRMSASALGSDHS